MNDMNDMNDMNEVRDELDAVDRGLHAEFLGQFQMAQAALNAWKLVLDRRYGLGPQDMVMPNGTIRRQDQSQAAGAPTGENAETERP